MIDAEDKPRQENTRIWLKPGENPKMGKMLDQLFLLLISNPQHRESTINSILSCQIDDKWMAQNCNYKAN